ncbi:hypothetical protein [Acanthamoeba polyphaga mimivirus]|uniref:Uncharacterized protein n=1 Tax=Acanthamoeba polyphaga mimivirus TaxID=212035 RepID=A0A0G2Y6X7_MIMIV|nr:hypothetical protein [Acanthamoeba polyphaga mimivirus]
MGALTMILVRLTSCCTLNQFRASVPNNFLDSTLILPPPVSSVTSVGNRMHFTNSPVLVSLASSSRAARFSSGMSEMNLLSERRTLGLGDSKRLSAWDSTELTMRSMTLFSRVEPANSLETNEAHPDRAGKSEPLMEPSLESLQELVMSLEFMLTSERIEVKSIKLIDVKDNCVSDIISFINGLFNMFIFSIFFSI